MAWRPCFEALPHRVEEERGAAVTAMPEVHDVPPGLVDQAQACAAGEPGPCMRVGDHYFSSVPDQRGRALYLRAADLVWHASPPLPADSGRAVSTPEAAIGELRARWPQVVADAVGTSMAEAVESRTPLLMGSAVGTGHGQISAELTSCHAGFRCAYQLEPSVIAL